MEAAEHFPPFEIVIDWHLISQIYGLFGILFLITFLVLVALLMRMKIFQAIKLGEAV